MVDYDITKAKLSPYYHSQYHFIAHSLSNLCLYKCYIYVKEFRPKIGVTNILCSKYVQLHYLTYAFKF